MDHFVLDRLEQIKGQDDDTSAEEDLQYITRTLRKYLDMDVVFISQFSNCNRIFKYVDSRLESQNIDIDAYDPLEQSYCQKIVEGEIPSIIPDTSLNPITKELAVTEKLSIRCYIGVPIILENGEIYGTLCCFGNEVDHTLGERDLATVKLFADIAGRQIEMKLKASRINSEIRQRLDEVLDPAKIEIVYQPIYNMQEKRVGGFESLARFSTDPYRSPDKWFKDAAQVGLSEKLEIMAITNAIKGLEHFADDIYITLNISPEHILSGAIARVLSDAPADRIVLEITEHSKVDCYAEFRAALQPLRDMGIRLAVDDVGAGFSSFQHILELGLDIIKLDISLIKNIHEDPSRRALASALIAFARETHVQIVAEGIECESELKELKSLGVSKVQGYFVGRPMPVAEALTYCPSF